MSNIDTLLENLMKNGRLLNLERYEAESLKPILKSKMKNNEISSWQIGNIGDFGYHVFINSRSIEVPVKNYKTWLMAI